MCSSDLMHASPKFHSQAAAMAMGLPFRWNCPSSPFAINSHHFCQTTHDTPLNLQSRGTQLVITVINEHNHYDSCFQNQKHEKGSSANVTSNLVGRKIVIKFALIITDLGANEE